MRRLHRHVLIDSTLQREVDRFPVETRPKKWVGAARCVTEFKDIVLSEGLIIQSNRCGWCALAIGVDGRRTAHRDHIAPKGKHPVWTFNPKNIVIACEYCNGFAVKGDIDTVSALEENYDDCEFYVVHPYLDDPDLHIEFAGSEVGVLVRGLSEKGCWTVENLQLDTPGMTMERVKDVLYSRWHDSLPEERRMLFAKAVSEIGS